MNRYSIILTGLGIILIIGCSNHENVKAKSVVTSHPTSRDTLKIITAEDIKNRILTDFGQNVDEATKILEEAISKIDYLNNDRIIRCIIFCV